MYKKNRDESPINGPIYCIMRSAMTLTTNIPKALNSRNSLENYGWQVAVMEDAPVNNELIIK